MQIIIKPKIQLCETQQNLNSSGNLSQQQTTDSTKKDDSVPFFKLFRFASKTDLMLISVGVIGSVIMGAAMPTFAFITGSMIDSFGQEGQVLDDARKNMYYYFGLGGLVLIVGSLSYASWMISGENQAVQCRKEYFKSLLQQQIGWFDTEQQSKIITNFNIDSFSFQLAVGEKISNLIVILFMLLTGLGISLYMGWILSLIILGYLPIIAVGWSYGVSKRQAAFKVHEKMYQQSDGKIQEVLSSIKLVKQMNAEQFQLKKNETVLQKIKDTYRSLGASYACGSFCGLFTLYAGFTLGFWYGGECIFGSAACPQSISTREYSAGIIINIFYALFLPAISLNQLTPCLEKIADGKAAASRIFSIIDRVPKIKSRPNATVSDHLQGIIEFVNVTFAYPKDKSKNILENFNIKIDCGYSGIIGESGCGKSTIFQLIMRFYDPDQGAVYLDGKDLRDLDLEWLRSQIGCVMQEPVLFASSIKQNLLLGNIDATDEQIEKALIKAEAFEFIYDLRDKLDTYVGSGEGQLQGGQKQRIAIARALLKNSKILLLDEATSALDRSNQRQIMQTLNNFSKDFIIINVTHRKRTLNDCQKVFIFKNKKIQRTIINKDSIKMIKSTNILNIPDCDKSSPQSPSRSQWKTLKNLSIQSKTLFPTSKTVCNDQAEHDKEDEGELNFSFSRIMDYLADKKCLLFFGFLTATIDGVVFPTVGLILSKIIVAQLKYNLDTLYFKDQVYKFCILMACLAVGGAVICAIRQMIFVILAESSVRHIKDKAFAKVINMPLTWFQKEENQPETVTQKITISCKVLYKFCQNYISHIYTICVNSVFSITLALYYQWRTGLTSLGLIPLIFLSQGLQMKFIQGYSESKGKIYNQSSQIVSESIMNIRTSFSLGGSRAFTNKYSQKIDVVHNVHLKNSIFSGFMFGLSYLLQYVCFALMFFLAAVYIKDNNLDIEGSMSAIFLVIFASISAGNQSSYLQDISSAKASAAIIFSIIDMQDEHEMLVKSGSKLLKEPIKGNIQFVDVSFKYMNRDRNVLESISFKINQGQKIAFVGLSGSGKSTIIKLLQRFYIPSSGTILLEGIDINDYDLHHLRKSLGIVSQEPVLFNESIEDNIKYNLTDASHQDIVKVAREANFDPDSQQDYANESNENHMSGFRKNVGPKGSHVSGGQKQRIAIARALLREPKVLLLDEATSALDAENESKIQQALNRIMQGKTTLNITHRLESTQKMDKIFVIEDGVIKESGNYKELMQKASLFLQMHQGNMKPM